ncbi:hypothetical protein ACOMHN_028440 [Nucella lapillus]
MRVDSRLNVKASPQTIGRHIHAEKGNLTQPSPLNRRQSLRHPNGNAPAGAASLLTATNDHFTTHTLSILSLSSVPSDMSFPTKEEEPSTFSPASDSRGHRTTGM